MTYCSQHQRVKTFWRVLVTKRRSEDRVRSIVNVLFRNWGYELGFQKAFWRLESVQSTEQMKDRRNIPRNLSDHLVSLSTLSGSAQHNMLAHRFEEPIERIRESVQAAQIHVFQKTS